MSAYLVPGYWCQVRKFGWLPDSPTACTDPDHVAKGRHVASERNIAQPEHSVIASWQRGAVRPFNLANREAPHEST